jgi:hypothetical protein
MTRATIVCLVVVAGYALILGGGLDRGSILLVVGVQLVACVALALTAARRNNTA